MAVTNCCGLARGWGSSARQTSEGSAAPSAPAWAPDAAGGGSGQGLAGAGEAEKIGARAPKAVGEVRLVIPVVGWFLVFVVSATVVVRSGLSLSRAGDRIAEATGLGRLWVGTILLALATSLPELVTNLSAVRLNAPALAGGTSSGPTCSTRWSWCPW